MQGILGELFIDLDFSTIIQVVVIGFIGGTLSGFLGSGGAFFMTPGMMNLGVEGVVAVASNITHKFGKAMIGSHKHMEMGNVDKKLALYLVITSFAGIRLAVWINSMLFEGGGDGHGAAKGAGANLYISLVFICILSVVAVSMLKDVLRSQAESSGPSRKIVDFIARFHLPPFIYIKVADVTVSLWILLIVGLSTGYLAGTIGVGGFIGVPAMIYVKGVPTAVAAGTELYLAMFMGAFGALNYAWEGYVDLRLTMLLYLGSLIGIHIGAYGVKVVNERYIRLVAAIIILLCALSRGVAIPMYLRQLDLLGIPVQWDAYFQYLSKIILFASGIGGMVIIVIQVGRSYLKQRTIESTIGTCKIPESVQGL